MSKKWDIRERTEGLVGVVRGGWVKELVVVSVEETSFAFLLQMSRDIMARKRVARAQIEIHVEVEMFKSLAGGMLIHLNERRNVDKEHNVGQSFRE